MRKYEVIIFERDGQQKRYEVSEAELNNFHKATGILDLPEQQKQTDGTGKRYFKLRDLAWHILLDSGVDILPVDLGAIAANKGWALLSYQQHAAALAMIDKAELRKQREGFSCEVAGRAIVCYGEVENKGRMRWTIAHEFGHLALRHSAAVVENYEQEANMFARRLLAPMGVLRACEVQDQREIAELCAISAQAAEYAYNRYIELMGRGKFYTSELEIKLRDQFKEFITNYLNK